MVNAFLHTHQAQAADAPARREWTLVCDARDYPACVTGCPFVTFPLGGVSEVVIDGVTGLLAEPDAPVTRGEMAVFLLKSKFGADHVPPGARTPRGESSQWGDYHLREAALYVKRLLLFEPHVILSSVPYRLHWRGRRGRAGRRRTARRSPATRASRSAPLS